MSQLLKQEDNCVGSECSDIKTELMRCRNDCQSSWLL